MRRTSIILVLFLISAAGMGQVKKSRNLPAFDYKTLHWGFTVGLNSMDFAVKRNLVAPDFVYADVIGFQPSGFQVNIVSDLRLSDYWNLRFLPGINLGSREVYFFDPNNEWAIKEIKLQGNEYVKSMTVGSSFLDFPLLLKYRSERVNNYRPYLIGGLSYRLDMSARGQFNEEDSDRFLLKKGDLYLEMGFGVDSYLVFFKYSTEIKLAVGLRNMMNTDSAYPDQEYFANSISGLRSFLVMVNFHFE